MVATWELEDVEVAARDKPETFFIPSLEERCTQLPGQQVRLHFLLRDRAEGQPRAERMWVEITAVQGIGHDVRFTGVLTNQPGCIESLHRGDEIDFEPRHIARVLVTRDSLNWVECAEQQALVSARALESGQAVRWAYRESPDNARDSGWRFFAGDETDDYANDASNVRVCVVGWLLDRFPSLSQIIRSSAPAAFEWHRDSESWRTVPDWSPELT